jgi:hypothetical protein
LQASKKRGPRSTYRWNYFEQRFRKISGLFETLFILLLEHYLNFAGILFQRLIHRFRGRRVADSPLGRTIKMG